MQLIKQQPTDLTVHFFAILPTRAIKTLTEGKFEKNSCNANIQLVLFRLEALFTQRSREEYK